MGSIETAFLLVFGSFLERGEVMSVLMLYRIASYYVVFAASAVGFHRPAASGPNGTAKGGVSR